MTDYELCRKMIEEDSALKESHDFCVKRFGEGSSAGFVSEFQKTMKFAHYKANYLFQKIISEVSRKFKIWITSKL